MSQPEEPPPPSVEVSGELTEASVETPPAEEPILPPAADLQDAVGAPTKRRPEPEAEPDERQWSRRTMMIAGGALIAGIGLAPRDGVHARQQFGKGKGLDQIVVAARHETFDPVVQSAHGRQE